MATENEGSWADERNGHRPLVKYVDERFGGLDGRGQAGMRGGGWRFRGW